MADQLIHDVPTIVSLTATTDQTDFTFPFLVFAPTDIAVTLPAGAPVNGYTVMFTAGVEGGTVRFDTPPVQPGQKVILQSVIPADRSSRFPNSGPVSMFAINREFDRHIRLIQDLRAGVARGALVPVGEVGLILPAVNVRAGGVLVFDNLGAPAIKPIGSFPAGPAGAADNTYSDMTAFRASDVTRKTASLVGIAGVADGRFNWTSGNFTGLTNLVDTIGSTVISVALGAWVRQKSESILHRAAPTAPATSVNTKLVELVNARDWGGIGDGGLHRLSEVYSTLAAAKAVYPFVTSLTQSLDWAACQMVLNLARDSRPTNRVIVAYIPGGRWVFTDSLKMASNVWLRGDKGATVFDNQNFAINVPQLTNDDSFAFQYTYISGIIFNGGRHGVSIDAQTTEANMMEDCAFALQSVSNYQCARLYQTSTMTRCTLMLAPYGFVAPGQFTNQNSWYSCEFNNHTEGSIRITGTGEGNHFVNCRAEAGGQAGRATIVLNNCNSTRWVGGYIEGTHQFVLSETLSSGSTSFTDVHFTGASLNGGFADYDFTSDGMVTITSAHGYMGIIPPVNAVIIGHNPLILGTQKSNIWRWKDIHGGCVKMRQVNPRNQSTFIVLRVKVPTAEGTHALHGTLNLQLFAVDSQAGVSRKLRRIYEVSVDNQGTVMTTSIDTVRSQGDAAPIGVTLEAAPLATSTTIDIRLVLSNVITIADGYLTMDFTYTTLNSDEKKPIDVIVMPSA